MVVSPKIYPLSERAVTIEFGTEVNEQAWLNVGALNKLLQQQPFEGFITTVPAYASLTVFYDPLIISQSVMTGADCFEKVSIFIKSLVSQISVDNNAPGPIITIPVCYGDPFSPDLGEVAATHLLSKEEVIRLHTETIYTVYMIGFMPGFAYMGGLSKTLATPRRSKPRASVPSGAVGIAGEQTGIYPLDTPGGWQIIGQTPLQLFDVNLAQPSLLKSGDQVKFTPISIDEFHRLNTY